MKNNALSLLLSLVAGLCLPLAGFSQNASISGFVWNDQNTNGLQDTLEPGLPAILVVLENTDSTVTSKFTDTLGKYTFTGLVADTFRLHFVNPGGVFQTLQNVGTNDSIDSDADPSGYTNFFALPDSQAVDFDAGFTATPPPCTTTITATVDSILCDDNNTPADTTDDKFTFRLKASGGTGTWSLPPDTLLFAYDSVFVFGPFSISGGPLTRIVTDSNNPLCTDTITVTPPAPCSTPDTCQTPITATFSDVLCHDNNTPNDSTDDVFTFKLTATGGTGTWSVPPDTTAFPYDSTFTFGPFPIAGGPLTLLVTDNADSLCTDSVTVTPPGPCSVPACDIKEIGCLKFELLGITFDSTQKRTYTIKVTNNCPDKLIYTAFQLPNGLTAKAPADNTVFTTPDGRDYDVRNPNFSPFYSIRFKPVVDSISNGQSDVFKYTLPAQAQPDYIHVIARIWPKVFYEAHLNTFSCKLVPSNFTKIPGKQKPTTTTPTTPGPAGPGTPTTATPKMQVFPNPTTGGQISIDLLDWAGQTVEIKLFNPQGKLILAETVKASDEPYILDLPAGLDAGLYWIKMTPANGKPQIERLVLQW